MNYRYLCSQFSKHQNYDGYVITKVQYEYIQANIDSTSKNEINDFTATTYPKSDCSIIRDRAPLAILQSYVQDEYGVAKLTLHLFKPKNLHPANEIKTSSTGSLVPVTYNNSFDMQWSQEQVTKFTTEVNDPNPIHQGKNAIVPGLQIMEQILIRYPVKACTLQFRSPLPVSEDCTYFITNSTDKSTLQFVGLNKITTDKLYFQGDFSCL